METKQKTTLIQGSVAKGMLLFALPIFISNLFQQLYNAADSLIVGNFLGSNALAAVGSSGSPIYLLIGFSQGVAVGAGVTLALQAFNENLVFFFSPTQVAAKEAPTGRTFRLGGVVEPGSVKRQADGVTVTFGITDTAKIVPVQYKGILPDLFAEGQGVVAQGKLDEQGVFCASEVLAKHDENYMPPEAAKALEDAHKAGVAKKQAEQAQAAKS